MKKLFGFIPFILLLFYFTSCSQSNDEAVKTAVKKYVDVWNGGKFGFA